MKLSGLILSSVFVFVMGYQAHFSRLLLRSSIKRNVELQRPIVSNMDKIQKIFSDIQSLTILETSELLSLFTNVFGHISSESTDRKSEETVAVPVETEKPTFRIVIKSLQADKKISVLKVVRVITGLGLKESKAIVDTVPQTVKSDLSKEDADKFKSDLESAGAEISIEKI